MAQNKGTREHVWMENFGFLEQLAIATTYKALLGLAVSANDLERLHELLPAHCRLNRAKLVELKQFWRDWISPYRQSGGARLADEAASWTLPPCPAEGLAEWYQHLLYQDRVKVDWDKYLLDPSHLIRMGLAVRYYGQSIRSGQKRKDHATIFRAVLAGAKISFTVGFRFLEPGQIGISFDLPRHNLTEALVYGLNRLPLAAPKSHQYFDDWSAQGPRVHLCTEIMLMTDEASACFADSVMSDNRQKIELSSHGEQKLLAIASKKLGSILIGGIRPVEIYYPTF